MSKAGDIRPDPTMIGNIAEPPFVRLPDASSVFAMRAQRFATLAIGHELGPYLNFLAALSRVQHHVQARLPEPAMPSAAARARSREAGMPPLDRGHAVADPVLDITLDRLFVALADIDMPAAARAALARASVAGAARSAMIRAVLADTTPAEDLADHIYVAAGLQIHFARQAARLDAAALVPVGEGACPACGGVPVTSQIVGWRGAHGARFCTCAWCATQWHVVRIKCVLCGSTGGIAYQEINGAGKVKGETCEGCQRYVKILHQHEDPALDPVADDVASLGLDLLLRDAGYRRGALNPFLVGY
jgi:FdhE protein